ALDQGDEFIQAMYVKYKQDAKQVQLNDETTQDRGVNINKVSNRCRVQDTKREKFAFWMTKQRTSDAYDTVPLLLHTIGHLARFLQHD
ncbi:MAG: hypothetical protein ABJQ90_10455, partial [Parasphingorhabdus sp.]